MDKSKVCDLLCLLNAKKPSEYSGDLLELLSINIKNVQENSTNRCIDLESSILSSDEVGNYLAWTFHLLKELKMSLMASDDALNVLSVQQNKLVRDALRESIAIGICYNLQPKLPQRIVPPSAYTTQERALTTDYHRLCYTTSHLLDLLPCSVLRPLVVFAGFQPLLNALYQIIYCPLKKPDPAGLDVITQELYQTFLLDKQHFKGLLQTCEAVMPRTIFIKETMLLLKTDSVWLKKAVGQNLTAILRANGLKLIATALLEDSRDYELVDTTKSWKATELLTKLVVSLRGAADFEENICGQLVELLHGKDFGLYSVIFAACVRSLFVEDAELCRRRLLSVVFEPLRRFLQEDLHKFENNEDITELMMHRMRLIKLVFDNQHGVEVPFTELRPYIPIICKVYSVVYRFNTEAVFEKLSEDMESILIEFLPKTLEDDKILSEEIFDCFIFGSSNNSSNIFIVHEELSFIILKNKLLITYKHEPTCIKENAEILLKLSKKTKSPQDMKMHIFLYLLNSLGNTTYSTVSPIEHMSRKMFLCNLLSEMVEAPDIQQEISENPWNILEYIANGLESAIERKINQNDADSMEFRSFFLLLMILDVLVSAGRLIASLSVTEKNTILLERLLKILKEVRADCVNKEVFALVKNVTDVLTGGNQSENQDNDVSKGVAPAPSELDKAVADICDPLLPIRTHGLIQLGKLVEERHPDVLDKKLFALNIFQQNIKNQDSFIYLAAINGLALMAENFPDTVLETLTDEYTSVDAIDLELRMKLGEVLVKVSRNLGDKLPKYKSLLLNTFMLGTKDDDHLLRASSLSNLGEVCQVLGYKLGTIVNEVLACVHNVIMTDPAVEARRAAVAVIRQLFVGLRADTAALLRHELAAVYRTLRRLYADDADDVLRLHAQLAIEELAVNMQELMQLDLPQAAQQLQQLDKATSSK